MPENPASWRKEIMETLEASKVGKRGTVVIPARLRKRFGIEEGSYVVTEERDEGILIRPAVVTPVRIYTKKEVAEYLLSNSVDATDYTENREEVRKLGLNPDKIDHIKPPGV